MNGYCIGIDLGGTNIKFGLMGKDHQAGEIFQLPTPLDKGRDAIIERIIEGVRRLIGAGAGKGKSGKGTRHGAGGPFVPQEYQPLSRSYARARLLYALQLHLS